MAREDELTSWRGVQIERLSREQLVEALQWYAQQYYRRVIKARVAEMVDAESRSKDRQS